jgi:hypothetical protein
MQKQLKRLQLDCCETIGLVLCFRRNYLYTQIFTKLGRRQHEVEFIQAENLFYAILFTSGGIGNLARQCGDNDASGLRVWIGRTVSGGLFGGGICAYWLGSSVSGSVDFSAWLYVFASGLIGFYTCDLKDRFLEPTIRYYWSKITGGKQN